MGSLKPIRTEAAQSDPRATVGAADQLPMEAMAAAPVPVLPSIPGAILKARLAPGRLQLIPASPAFVAPVVLGRGNCRMLPPLFLSPAIPTLQLAHRPGMTENWRCLPLPSTDPAQWSRGFDPAMAADALPAPPAVPARLGT